MPLGKPKFDYDDFVSFEIDGERIRGYVFIIDAYGTFGQNDEPSYDIMASHTKYGDKCLFKHIRESRLTKVSQSN